MIYLNSNSLNKQLTALVKVFDRFPKHIAKKHIGAAMKRALKFAVPILKSNTPKGGSTIKTAAVTRNSRGQFLTGSGKKRKVRGGALRRAVVAKSKYVGTNKAGFTVGTLGYKYGTESKKALWLEFGTKMGVKPKLFMEKTYNEVKGKVAANLAKELAAAVESAARDLAPGVEQGYGRK